MKFCWFLRLIPSPWPISVLALFLIALPSVRADRSSASSKGPVSISRTSTSQAEEEQRWEIPFAYDPPGRPLLTVQVRINQSMPLTFIVDTGADNMIVFPWTSKLLDLKSTGITIPSSSGKSVAALLQPCDFVLASAPGSHDLTVHVETPLMAEVQGLQVYPGAHVAGIIGGLVFQQRISRFDFDRKILTFFPEKAVLPRPEGPFTTLTLFKEIERERSAVQLALPGAPPITFILDTGSDTSSAPATIATKVASLATGRTWLQHMEGSQVISTLLLAELPLGGLSAELVELALRPDRTQGLLGLNVLTRFRMTLDPHRGLLTLEPRPGYQSRLAGHSGSLEEHAGALTIVGIEDMAARRGGVRIGDRILTINGESAKNMNAMEAELKFNGYEGTEATLELEKPDGQHRSVKLRPRSNFPSVVRSSLGMLIIQDKGRSARIIQIQPDSEAAHAGIMPGDELMAINSKTTAELTAAALLHELGEDTANGSPLKTLTIRHPDSARLLLLQVEGSQIKTPQSP